MTDWGRTSRPLLRHLQEVAHHRLVVPRVRRSMPAAVRARDAARVARLLHRVTRTRVGHAASRSAPGGGAPVVDVVLLAKSGLTADLDAAFVDDAGVRVWVLEREWIKAVAADFLAPDVADYHYIGLGEDHEERRLAYRAFLVEVLRRYLPSVGARTVVTGNFVYWAERELGPALRDAGGRLLVLHKEGLLAAWPLTEVAYRRALRAGVGVFEGEAIGVYTAEVARLLVDAGVVTADRVRVVGTPRVDEGHAHRRAGRPGVRPGRITFFTFPTWRGLTFPFDPEPTPLPDVLTDGWTRLLDGTVEAIIELAARRPDLEVIAKVKAGGEDDAATARLRAASERSRRDGKRGLRLVVAGEGGELILTSQVVVAFNSTVIPEALAAGTAVVVPGFAEAAADGAQAGLLDLGSAVHTARSPEELIDAVIAAVDTAGSAPAATGSSGRDLPPETEALLDRLTGNADGRAGERLRAFVVGADT
jgi:hypothetical protein